MNSDMGLDDLVNISEKLLCDIGSDSDMPRISRNLDQMRNFGQKLHLMRESKSETKAARLLGSKMSYVLPANLSQKIEESEPGESFIQASQYNVQDIHSFLKNMREKGIVDANEYPRLAAFNYVKDSSDKFFKTWWSSEISSVLASLSGNQIFPILGHQLNSVSSSRFQQKTTHKNLNYPNLSFEDTYFVKKINQYLYMDFMSLPILEILKHFTSIVDENDRNSKAIPSITLLSEICFLVKELFQRLPSAYLSKTYQQTNNEQIIIQRMNPQIMKKFVEASREILANEFIEFVRVAISKRSVVSRIGGKPSILDMIRAYFNFIKSEFQPNTTIEYEDGFYDSVPVWAMIYFCLRAGCHTEAHQVAQESCGKYFVYIQNYLEDKESPNSAMISELKHISKQLKNGSTDVYKQAVFCLLCRQDFADNTGLVFRSADDFLWFKLSQIIIPESNVRATESHSSLVNLQSLIHDTYGEQHFRANEEPLLYFKLLLLTQQFEAAIAFLARFQIPTSNLEGFSDGMLSHAAYLAIMLKHMGLLCHTSGQDAIMKPLLTQQDSNGLRVINFPRLILMYVRRFELHHIPETVDYLAFLCELNKNSPETAYTSDIFVTSLVELLLKTGEFDLILGKIDDNDHRHAGLIDKFCKTVVGERLGSERVSWLCAKDLDHDILMKTLAENFESRGRDLEAIQTYLRLSYSAISEGKLANGLRCMNSLLVNLIQLDCIEPTSANISEFNFSSNRHVLHLAAQMATRLRNCVSPKQAINFEDSAYQDQERCLFLLLDFHTFLNLVDEGNWQLAVDCLDRLDHLLPQNAQNSLETSLAGYQVLPELVKRALPRVVLATMKCLVEISRTNKAEKSSSCDPRTNLESRFGLESRARALISFIGRIPQRIPGDFYTRLTRMETQLLTF